MSWTEGQELTSIKKPTITREQLQEYADASGDDNLIHLDEEVAKKSGLPGIIAHGMLSMAFMADHVRANFPEKTYHLKRLKSRFRKVIFPGDELTCGGSVKKSHPEGGLLLRLWVKNQKGEVATEGEAEVTAI